MSRDELRELHEGTLDYFGRNITVGQDGVWPGFLLSDGTDLVLFAREYGDGLRVTDCGVAWNSLVMGGYTDFLPTAADAARVERMCALYGCSFDPMAGEVYTTCGPEESGDGTRRVVSAALALDAWRAWYPQRPPTRKATQKRLETSIAHAVTARSRDGWWVTSKPPVRLGSSGRAWRSMFEVGHSEEMRNASVSVNAMSDDSPDVVLDRALGFALDTKRPLILLVKEMVARKIEGSSELRVGLSVVSRDSEDPNEPGERVIRAATKLLEAA